MAIYKVKREHYGDKFYRTGEQREANPNDVKHLVAIGVLAEASEVVEPKVKKTPAKQVKPDDQSAES